MFPRSLHVLRRAFQRYVARVRLRCAREVDRRLREVQARLRQPDVLDGLGGGDCDQQRARIRVADVLGREHDHSPRDEARVFAALEHRGEVVDARVGIGAAHRLDERRDEVVVRVGGLVVEERALACRIVNVCLRQRLAGGLRRLQGELDDVVDGARVAAGASGDEPEQVVGDLGAQLRGPAATTVSSSSTESGSSS